MPAPQCGIDTATNDVVPGYVHRALAGHGDVCVRQLAPRGVDLDRPRPRSTAVVGVAEHNAEDDVPRDPRPGEIDPAAERALRRGVDSDSGLVVQPGASQSGDSYRPRPRGLRPGTDHDEHVLTCPVAARHGTYERVVLPTAPVDRDSRIRGAVRQPLRRRRMRCRRPPGATLVGGRIDPHRPLLDAVRAREEVPVVRGVDGDRGARLRAGQPRDVDVLRRGAGGACGERRRRQCDQAHLRCPPGGRLM
jgi:hypothetical protein